jgi:hypothetical protein
VSVERKTIAHPDFLFWLIKKNYNIRKKGGLNMLNYPTTLNNKYYKLSRLIDRLHRKIAFAPPSDMSDIPKERRERALEWEKFEKESIHSMLDELKEEFENLIIWSHRKTATPLGRFGVVYDLIVDFGFWEGPTPDNPHFDPRSFGGCMSKLSKYVGDKDANKLFQLVNEILISLLKIPQMTTKEKDG